jgi:hypothetical protein
MQQQESVVQRVRFAIEFEGSQYDVVWRTHAGGHGSFDLKDPSTRSYLSSVQSALSTAQGAALSTIGDVAQALGAS